MLRASYNEGFTAPSLPLLNNASQWATRAHLEASIRIARLRRLKAHTSIASGTAGNPEPPARRLEGKSAGIVFEVPGSYRA